MLLTAVLGLDRLAALTLEFLLGCVLDDRLEDGDSSTARNRREDRLDAFDDHRCHIDDIPVRLSTWIWQIRRWCGWVDPVPAAELVTLWCIGNRVDAVPEP